MTITSRSDLIANILRTREPLVKEIEHKQGILQRRKATFHALKDQQEQIFQSGVQTLIDRVKDLPFGEMMSKIDKAISDLEKLKSRFARKTINIGVVGQARQGKSRLLQSVSGLDAKAIPTGRSEHCTGVRSLICHIPSGTPPYGEITFYREEEFLKEVLAPYYKELQLGNPPSSLSDFANTQLPPLPPNLPGYAVPTEAYKHLRDKYKGQIDSYKTLIGADILRIPIEEVREYVAQDTEDAKRIYNKYLAVKEARVMCTFGDADVGQIALVDMPGLGDTVVGAEERLIQALGEHIDIVLFVFMPTPVAAMLNKTDFLLYDLTYQALEELPVSRWSFMVLNHAPSLGSKEDSHQYNYTNCVNIQQKTLAGNLSYEDRSIKVVGAIIADCSDKEAVRHGVLDRVLSYLVQNIRDLDKDYLLAWQKRLTLLQTEIDALLGQAQSALSITSSRAADDKLFEDLFRHLWGQLTTALNNVLRNLERDAMKPNSTFDTYFQNKLKRCREDTGLPKPEDITEFYYKKKSYEATYRLLLHEIRTHLTQHFADIDQELELSMENVKGQVAQVFLQEGHLANILEQAPASEFFFLMATHEGLALHLCQVFQNLASYKLSLRGYFQSLIRLENLNNIIPNSTTIQPASQTIEALLKALEGAQQEAVNKIEKTLKPWMSIPGASARAVIEEFVDQALYSRHAEDDWRAFYRTNQASVWIPQFKETAIKEQAQREWQIRVNNAMNVNQLDSLQFSYRP